MNHDILPDIDLDEVRKVFTDPNQSVIFVTAPNFEDRSTRCAEWISEFAADGAARLAVHVLTLQTPGVDDIFDRVKADNRDHVTKLFRRLDSSRRAVTQIDLPADETRLALDRTRELARHMGGPVVVVLDISSMPRTIVRHLLDGLLSDWNVNQLPRSGRRTWFDRLICLYTAAGKYPAGADSDVLGGINGYFTGRPLHELISMSSAVDAFISLAGTQHDAAQALDALWSNRSPMATTVTSLVYLNGQNLLYSYRRLTLGTWALNKAIKENDRVIFAFDINDAIRHIFAAADAALSRHGRLLAENEEERPILLIGGFGPKPIGLAALLSRKRYEHMCRRMGIGGNSDVLQVTGWQYTTRYSHGTGPMMAFEVLAEHLFRYDPDVTE